jgi:hypothetical protein
MFNKSRRDIGNLDLIKERTDRIVLAGKGGTLSDYIPFYFTPCSIMMYNIHTGYNVPKVPNEEIVILVSSLSKVAESDIPFVFTDQHAYLKTAKYYDNSGDLTAIDWSILQNIDFKHDPDDPGKKARYQAECLIWRHVPISALLGICSHDETVDGWIKSELSKRGLDLKSIVQRNWYFS